jgi:hypothetical protein
MDCNSPMLHGHVGKAPELHSCGYPEDTFACKIRHLQINTGAAKAAGPARPRAGESQHVEITPTGRVIR